MGLFKAARNYILRCANDSAYRSEKAKAHKQAYAATGKDIEKAKKQRRRINPSYAYKKHFNEVLERAEEKRDRRDKFLQEW